MRGCCVAALHMCCVAAIHNPPAPCPGRTTLEDACCFAGPTMLQNMARAPCRVRRTQGSSSWRIARCVRVVAGIKCLCADGRRVAHQRYSCKFSYTSIISIGDAQPKTAEASLGSNITKEFETRLYIYRARGACRVDGTSIYLFSGYNKKY